MNRLARTLAALVAAATAALIVASPAHAADDTAVDTVKAEVIRRIDLRLAALTRFEAAIGAAVHLTDAHETTLRTIITEDRAGLTDLKAKVGGETALTALRADAKIMVDDYRIFLLVAPKVRLTMAGDAESAAIARLRTLHTTLTDLVSQAKAGGADTAAAEQDLADMDAALDKATADTDDQVAALLAVQPGPDGAAIRAKVVTARSALHSGRASLRTAVAEARHVRDFLKA